MIFHHDVIDIIPITDPRASFGHLPPPQSARIINCYDEDVTLTGNDCAMNSIESKTFAGGAIVMTV
jgi:hypothetical protein